MLTWWLTTFVLFSFLLAMIVFVYFTIKGAVNTEDAYRIDPLPDDEQEKKK